MFRALCSAAFLALIVADPALAQDDCKMGIGSIALDRGTQALYAYENCGGQRKLRTLVLWSGVERDSPNDTIQLSVLDAQRSASQRLILQKFRGYAQGAMLSSRGSWWLVANRAGAAAIVFVAPDPTIEFVHEYRAPAADSIGVLFVQQQGRRGAPEVEAAETIQREMILPFTDRPPLSRGDRASILAIVHATRFGAGWQQERN
jgi:hypothetical protein